MAIGIEGGEAGNLNHIKLPRSPVRRGGTSLAQKQHPSFVSTPSTSHYEEDRIMCTRNRTLLAAAPCWQPACLAWPLTRASTMRTACRVGSSPAAPARKTARRPAGAQPYRVYEPGRDGATPAPAPTAASGHQNVDLFLIPCLVNATRAEGRPVEPCRPARAVERSKTSPSKRRRTIRPAKKSSESSWTTGSRHRPQVPTTRP